MVWCGKLWQPILCYPELTDQHPYRDPPAQPEPSYDAPSSPPYSSFTQLVFRQNVNRKRACVAMPPGGRIRHRAKLVLPAEAAEITAGGVDARGEASAWRVRCPAPRAVTDIIDGIGCLPGLHSKFWVVHAPHSSSTSPLSSLHGCSQCGMQLLAHAVGNTNRKKNAPCMVQEVVGVASLTLRKSHEFIIKISLDWRVCVRIVLM